MWLIMTQSMAWCVYVISRMQVALDGHARKATFIHNPQSTRQDERETSTSGRGQREQENELEVLRDLPAQEQRFEWLAAWVGSALAFGAAIWHFQGAQKGQE